MRLSPPDEPEWLYGGDWYIALPVLALGMHMQLEYTSLHPRRNWNHIHLDHDEDD